MTQPSSGQPVATVHKLATGNVMVTVGSFRDEPGVPASGSSVSVEFTPEQAFQFAMTLIKHSGRPVAVMDLG